MTLTGAGGPAADAPGRGAVRRRLIDHDGEVLDHVERGDVEKRLADHTFFWLDLDGLGDEELGWLRDVFAFHPLAVEDVEHFGERPKLEEYDGYSFLVLYGSGVTAVTRAGGDGTTSTAATGATATDGDATDGAAIDPGSIDDVAEVHCFVSSSYFVSVHKDACPALAGLVGRFAGRRVAVSNPARIVYRIADALVDSFYPVLSDLDDRIDALQTAVVAKPDNRQLSELLSYRNALISLRKVVSPQRDLFASLASGVSEIPGFDQDDELRYFRDVYDHLIRLSDLIDGYRDLLSGTTDAYLSVVSNQLNVVMKQLTIISTVFLPLSFLTGFFGQNFTFLTSHIGGTATFWFVGVGSEVVAVLALMALFRRRGWLGSQA